MAKTVVPLTIARPEIAAEWHPTLNGEMSPDDVGTGSKYKAWWQCSNDTTHVFQISVALRIQRPCPLCKIATKSLLARFPDIARELHPTKNGDLDPKYLPPTTLKPVWWQCDKNIEHVWEESVFNRMDRKNLCLFCKGTRVREDNSLAYSHPELATQWHPTKNDELTPQTVTRNTKRKVWWRCKLNHEWEAPINVRTTRGSGCPFCSGKYLLKEKSLAVRYPEIAAQWHQTKNRQMLLPSQGSWSAENNLHLAPQDRPTKNRRLTPGDVSFGSGEKVWWQCPINKEHEWQALVDARTLKGTGCPFCSANRVASDNNFAVRHPTIAKQWHPTRNKGLLPTEITPGSDKSVWWRCPRSATHVWQARVPDVIKCWHLGHNGCPYCSGKKILEESSLSTKFPAVAKLWHPTQNDSLTPKHVTPASIKYVWWQCATKPDHVWKGKIQKLVKREQSGQIICPFCAGKCEVNMETGLIQKRRKPRTSEIEDMQNR